MAGGLRTASLRATRFVPNTAAAMLPTSSAAFSLPSCCVGRWRLVIEATMVITAETGKLAIGLAYLVLQLQDRLVGQFKLLLVLPLPVEQRVDRTAQLGILCLQVGGGHVGRQGLWLHAPGRVFSRPHRAPKTQGQYRCQQQTGHGPGNQQILNAVIGSHGTLRHFGILVHAPFAFIKARRLLTAPTIPYPAGACVKRGLKIVKSSLNLPAAIASPAGVCHNGTMTGILLVDDDRLITDPLARALREAGYIVWTAATGPAGLEMAETQQPDAVILDIMLPGMDGWQVCQALRRRSAVPILMLTALGDEVDRILGLELGADDYLTKPFSTRELQARLRALLRRVALDRSSSPAGNQLQVGPIRLDLNTRRAFKGGEELTLRFKEFEVLSLLLSRPGEAISRAELFDEVWGTDWLGDTRTLDVHIRWLREKIEDNPSQPQLIQTVRGVGYRFATGERSH